MVTACLATLTANHARGQIADVVGAFKKISGQATLAKFDRGDVSLPRGGHLQGIQIRFDAADDRHLVFLSHDSATVAYLVIVEFPGNLAAGGRILHVHTFPSDGRSPPLRHAGGIQLVGDLLVVGLEDNQQKTRSEIQFWNVGNPQELTQLKHLTIRRSGLPKDKTAGGVGIAKRKRDYIVAVANWDSRAIDFYRLGAQWLDDPNCRFELLDRYSDDAAVKADWQPDGAFGRHQSINLLADAEENLFLIGTHTAGGKDVADLFAIDTSANPNKLLRKVASRSLRLAGGSHFRSAGGVSILNGKPAILASPRNLSPETRISISR